MPDDAARAARVDDSPDETTYEVGRPTLRVVAGQRDAPPARHARRRRDPWAAPARSSRPDRVALWAVLLGLFLALVSVATARGSEPAPGAGGPSPAAAEQPAR